MGDMDERTIAARSGEPEAVKRLRKSVDKGYLTGDCDEVQVVKYIDTLHARIAAVERERDAKEDEIKFWFNSVQGGVDAQNEMRKRHEDEQAHWARLRYTLEVERDTARAELAAMRERIAMVETHVPSFGTTSNNDEWVLLSEVMKCLRGEGDYAAEVRAALGDA